MKKGLVVVLLVMSVCFFVGGVSAQDATQNVSATVVEMHNISINEFESNPPGADPGNEWVELYNSENADVNMSGWKLYENVGAGAPSIIYSFPDGSFIGANEFFVAEIAGSKLTDSGESLTLKNEYGIIVDETPIESDQDNDDKTWQREPDGGDTWILKEGTKNSTNYIPAVILNESHTPGCAFEYDNITLSAVVENSCGGEVIFSVRDNGVWKNFSSTLQGEEYHATIPAQSLSAPQMIDWRVIARDCATLLTYGNITSFKLYSESELDVNPSAPDGQNGWYISPPTFTIMNPDALNITYRWDGIYFSSAGENVSFGLEDTPNNGNVTGGKLMLRYRSSVICGTEEEQDFLGKFDFTDPVITNVQPEENSTVGGEITISALIDELYAQNSGINTVTMKVDGASVSPDIDDSGELDKVVSTMRNLSDGAHNVEIEAEDVAGRSSIKSWTFYVDNSVPQTSLVIYSPDQDLYDVRKIAFNISTGDEVERLSYIDNRDSRPRERLLCRNCDSYGLDRVRYKNMKEGENDVIFVARNGDDEERIEKTFIVDSKAPKIRRISPTRGFADGTFHVEFTEANPTELKIIYGNESTDSSKSLNISECQKDDDKYECDFYVNISAFEGQEIKYHFELKDIVNRSATSREGKIKIDGTDPVFDFVNYVVEGRRVKFSIGVNETNFDKLTYMDQDGGRERTLCSRLKNGRCETTKSFRYGEYNLTLTAYDDADNFATENIGFLILP